MWNHTFFASLLLFGTLYCAGASVEPCSGHKHIAKGTGYFPSNDPIEGGFVDMHGKKLRTLQDFLQGNASYVSVAMDDRAGIPYGTIVCIPEMNKHLNRNILFKVVDTGSAFKGKGFSRIDICVRTRQQTYDPVINGHLTLVFKNLNQRGGPLGSQRFASRGETKQTKDYETVDEFRIKQSQRLLQRPI